MVAPGRWQNAGMWELIDSHCHLDAPEFDADRAEVLARARSAGVGGIVIPAIDAAGWEPLAKLCVGDPELFPAYGLHPMFLDRHTDDHLRALGDWLHAHPAVAVGECGLDFYVEGLDPQRQAVVFEAQLRLAREFDLPLILHARRAVDAVIAALRRIGGLRGVVHSFSGSAEQAAQLGKLGFLLGIGGPVTYERAQRLRRVVAQMPLEQLLLESDAPDQPPTSRRGRRNEPDCVREVLVTVAALRGESEERIAEATSANARRLFGLPQPA
jgi:TatD DNase family protein